MITGAQIREARRLLGWSPRDLERGSGVPKVAIARAEGPLGVGAITISQANAIQAAFEKRGVQFIPENGGGAGMRMRKPDKHTSGVRIDVSKLGGDEQ